MIEDIFKLKIRTDLECYLLIDNIYYGRVIPNVIKFVSLSKGEYFISLISAANSSYYYDTVVKLEHDKAIAVSFKEEVLTHKEWINPHNVIVDKINGKYVFIDSSVGIEYGSSEHNYLDYYRPGLAVVKSGDNYGVIDYLTKEILPCDFETIYPLADFLVIPQTAASLLVNRYNQVILYDEIIELGYGLYKVSKGQFKGLLNQEGCIIVDCIYVDIQITVLKASNPLYNEHNVELYKSSGEKDILTIMLGTMLRKPSWYLIKAGDKYGAAFVKGLYTIPNMYSNVLDLSWMTYERYPDKNLNSYWEWRMCDLNECLCVEINGKYGVINNAGKQIVPCEYDKIVFTGAAGVSVKSGDMWGYIDATHNISCNYESVQICHKSNGTVCIIIVRYKGVTYRLDSEGTLHNWDYSYCGNFHDNRACVRKDGNWGYIDEELREVIPCKYLYVSDFKEGKALIRDENKHIKCIDLQGDEVAYDGNRYYLEMTVEDEE